MQRDVKAADSYLDVISGASDEKAELVEYVERLERGRILEIGPGAGTAL